MSDSIYEFENYLKDGRMVEPIRERIMYDIRGMSREVDRLGRALTIEEAKKYIVNE